MSDLSFVILFVENVQRSAAFYSELLEKPVVNSSLQFATIPAGPGLTLGLSQRDEAAPDAARPGGGEIAITLPDQEAVDATFERWGKLGVKPVLKPTQMNFGYTFVGRDPDGHLIRALAIGKA